MIKKYLSEFGIALGLLAILVSLINPYWMPMGLHMALLVVLCVVFGVYAMFVWREGGGDERDRALLQKSDRIAFLVGSGVLVFAIAYEGLILHQVTPWLVVAFSIMIIAKALSFIYFKEHN